MDLPDISNLMAFLKRKEVVRVSIENDPEILFYGPSWIPVFCYVLKFLSSSDEEQDEHAAVLKRTIKLLEDSVPHRRRLKKPDEKENHHIVKLLWKNFVPHVQKYFKVPVETSSAPQLLNQNEILAALLDFLLQIWNTQAYMKRDEIHSEVCNDDEQENKEDEILNMPACVQKNQLYALVHMELKHLLAFLGDVPFQCYRSSLQDHLNTILAEFEALANEAAHFTLSFILAPHPERFTELDVVVTKLVDMVELLKSSIRKYCVTFSELIPVQVPIAPTVTIPIDSLFIVDSLFEDLESVINRRFHVTVDIDMNDQIGVLYEEVKFSRAFLKHTKLVSRETKSILLKECFIEIREIAYEAEYILNSYVVGNIPIWYLTLRLPAIIRKLMRNRSKHQQINSDDDVSHVTDDFTVELSLLRARTATTAVKDHLVGIEETKNEIMDKIIRGSKSLTIISLVGMPGLGKTTLAKSLFDSSSIQNHFDRCAWCVISQNYSKRKFFLETLMSLSKICREEELLCMDNENLGLKIHQSLKGNRYLIVIDDIWVASTWDDIRRYFPDDSNGSRIMLTSRNKDATPTESIYPTLRLLSEVESMNLLMEKVFLDESCPQRFLGVMNKISKRCKGLPLAVVAIAGILANLEKDEKTWEQVESDLEKFVLDDVEGSCMKVLEFSYEHLPDHLKMCFLYLGSFPEDTKISVGKIIRLWIVERFIEKVEGQSPEDVAENYLHDLINRSLVLIVRRKLDGGIKTCGLHDLLRDFSLRKADETDFMKCTKKPFSMYVRHHRLRVDCDKLLLASHFGLHCRSFSGKNLSAASSCFPQMPLHRVINLLQAEADDYETTDRQQLEGIDMLVHLRYLYARGQSLSTQSVSNLVNLEVLDVSHFSDDKIALSILLKMVMLKHLKTKNGYTQIISDCSDRCETSNLRSLSAINIHSLEDEGTLKYFPHLRKLRVKLCHSRFPDISSLTVLETLRIDFFSDRKIDFTTVIFPRSIKELTLYKIGFSWNEMSIIGRLPNLQVLILLVDAFVGEKWETMNGEFQKLSILQLISISSLEQWITSSEHFPELQCLLVDGCHKLKDIPCDLGYIPTLHKIEVNTCSYMVSKSGVHIEEEQREMGNELQVSITNSYWNQKNLVQEYKKIKGVFRLLDEGCANNKSELLNVMRSVGINPSENELQRMINAYADGNIEFLDFLDLIAEIRIPCSDHMIEKAFKFFDRRQKRRFIDVSSLYEGLRELGHELSWEKVEKIVSEADIDGDGKLNELEFNRLIKSIDVASQYDLRTALFLLEIPGENNWSKDIKDVFSMFDFEGDGCIKINNLIRHIEENGQMHDIITKVDPFGNGTIDFPHFYHLYFIITFGEETYKELFKSLDKDQTGFISVAKLCEELSESGFKLTDEEAEEMIRECDVDGDGQLNYHEFLKFNVKLMLKSEE